MALRKINFSAKTVNEFSAPLNPNERQKYLKRVAKDSLPRKAKVYLIDLMHRRPNASRLLVNMLQRNIKKIVINGDISNRLSLDEYLTKSVFSSIESKKVTKREIAHFKKEMEEAGYLTTEEIKRILAEMQKRTKLSSPEAHLIIHYFITTKVLDKIIQLTANGKMKVRTIHKNGL